MTSQAEQIAAGLTDARKKLLIALPADGSWGKAPSRSVAKRFWWNTIPPLIDHKHGPEDAREWALNVLGQQVRAILAAQGESK